MVYCRISDVISGAGRLVLPFQPVNSLKAFVRKAVILHFSASTRLFIGIHEKEVVSVVMEPGVCRRNLIREFRRHSRS
jgi:hypothetical protein